VEHALLRAEVGFHGTWALDNVFPCPDRAFGHERADVSQVGGFSLPVFVSVIFVFALI